MTTQKLFAGHAVRRIRRTSGLTQAVMAQSLDVSPSYLNLIERNQRPLTAPIMLRLAERYDFDARSLTSDAPGGGAEALVEGEQREHADHHGRLDREEEIDVHGILIWSESRPWQSPGESARNFFGRALNAEFACLNPWMSGALMGLTKW
ncbi:MAG: helix-turn-helix transcriptional regulator [Rhodomicrobium sp.]|nr:helix-turn-helix transcriptional regulator [Rhodomicrobium sp.]